MITTIAIACHAGGVGKTTTTYHLANALTENDDRNVLVVDLDPQASLSRLVCTPAYWRGNTASSLLTGALLDMPYHTANGWGIIPTDIKLQETEAWMQLQLSTHDHLSQALHRYDNFHIATRGWLLLDCPPAAGLLTINALVAADQVIVPVIPEPKGLDGLKRMIELLDWLKDRGLSSAQIAGAIITQIDRRTNLHNGHVQKIRETGIPVLGEIPAARGQNAQDLLANAYDDLARRMIKSWQSVGGADA